MKTILVVEDNNAIRDNISEMLTAWIPGSKVIKANDGKVGLKEFIQYKPDLVVTDCEMPVMDGIEMSRNILTINPNAAIVMFSGNKDLTWQYVQKKIKCLKLIQKPKLDKLISWVGGYFNG